MFDINGNPVSTSKPFDGKNVVVLGDSIFCFGASTGGTGTIADYLQSMAGGNWINWTVGGTTLSAYRLQDNAYEHFTFGAMADAIASGDFASQQTGSNNGVNVGDKVYSMLHTDLDSIDSIVACYGTNDLAFKVSQVGTSADSATKNGTMCGALKYAVDKIQQAKKQIKIYLCGVMFRVADSVSDSTIISANDELEKTCALLGVPFINIRAEMGINASNYTHYLYDGTHPNGNGKIRYAETVFRNL